MIVLIYMVVAVCMFIANAGVIVGEAMRGDGNLPGSSIPDPGLTDINPRRI